MVEDEHRNKQNFLKEQKKKTNKGKLKISNLCRYFLCHQWTVDLWHYIGPSLKLIKSML